MHGFLDARLSHDLDIYHESQIQIDVVQEECGCVFVYIDNVPHKIGVFEDLDKIGEDFIRGVEESFSSHESFFSILSACKRALLM